MEGGGGGIEHFASMLRQHLDRAIVDRATPMSQLGLWHFNPGMGMLGQVLKQPGMSDAFQAALLRHGFVGALVSGIYSLHLVEGNHTIASSMTTAATLVRQLISRPPGLAWVSEALRAGFLPIFLRTAHAFRDEDKLRQEFEYQLAQLFSPYMVYRSILTLMPDILTQVADLVRSDAFMASPLFAPWQRFQALVEDRLAFLQEFALTPSILHKACDNLCNQVLLKAELKRCVCLDLYYCSKQCQIADWREGHREVCRNVCGFRSLPEEQQLTVHDRAFLRALLRRDYLAFRPLTYARQVSDWAQTLQQPRLFFLDFNYMAGPVAIANRRWNYSKLSCMGFPPQWLARFRDHAVRAWKSEGLLEVHVMAIPHGLKKHWKIIPMRHTRPEIVEGLWAIARNVAGMQPTDPMFDSTVANELQPLLKIDPQFIYE
ncbi:hypothetical protein C8R46DRAFT_359963 [Mycena filopes]|nr:hypothetical protein C8R46DRAFT_359963 [Mycena filopes]